MRFLFSETLVALRAKVLELANMNKKI